MSIIPWFPRNTRCDAMSFTGCGATNGRRFRTIRGMIRAEMLHATTIAFGACLLFLSQPFLGRQLLPWLGGSAAVWSASLVTFQFALLAGYVYADQLTRRFAAIVQRRIHLAIVAG